MDTRQYQRLESLYLGSLFRLRIWKYVSTLSQQVASKLLIDLKSMIRRTICKIILEGMRQGRQIPSN